MMRKNVRLITAAPELLDALIDILNDYENRHDTDVSIINSAKQAIKKATNQREGVRDEH
jgi:hypothetical protein